MRLSKKDKRNGIIATLIFHSILLLSFFFLGLKYKDPPPPEEGISIDFGNSFSGAEEQAESVDNKIEPIKETVIEKQIESNEEKITQNIEEVIEVDKEKNITKVIEKEKEEIIEEEKPEVNKKALYKGQKKKKISEGNENRDGDLGNIEGNENSDILEGGGDGSNDMSYQLSGRSVNLKVKPEYNLQVEGKIVVTIIVNRNGDVISAIPGAKGSTSLNKQLLDKAKKAALKTKFSSKENAPENQKGKIIYYFSLN